MFSSLWTKSYILNQRAYMLPYFLCIIVYHMPLFGWFLYVVIKGWRDNCDPVDPMYTWIVVAGSFHIVTAFLCAACIFITLNSAVYLETRKEKYITISIFILHLFDLGWSIHGKLLDMEDLDACSDVEFFYSIVNDIDSAIYYNFVCSILNVVFWILFTCACGGHFFQDTEMFQQRWKRRCECAYKVFTCSSPNQYDEVFDMLGHLFVHFLTARGSNNQFQTIQVSDITFLLNLVRKAQNEEKKQNYKPVPSIEQTPYTHPVDYGLPVSDKLIEEIAYYGNLAIGVYGWPQFVCYNPGQCFRVFSCCNPPKEGQVIRNDNRFNSHRVSFLKYSNLEEEDLIYMNRHNSVFKSPYAIVRNKNKKQLIISIRGSMSWEDFLVDGFARPVVMDENETNSPVPVSTHEGVLRTTRALFAHLQEGSRRRVFWNFLNENPEYSVVVCGHSLGAAVASQLTIMLRCKFPKTRGFAFASPPIFNPQVARWCKDFITTVVYGDDIIPRLSIPSLARLRYEMLEQFCMVSNKKLLDVLVGHPNYGELNNDIEAGNIVHHDSDVQTQLDEWKSIFEYTNDPELDIAGQIIHIETREQSRACGCTIFRGQQDLVCSIKEADKFKRIWVNARTIPDHMPHHYDRCIRYLVPDKVRENQSYHVEIDKEDSKAETDVSKLDEKRIEKHNSYKEMFSPKVI